MAEERVERRLVAILAADVVGYSRLVAHDEEGTLATLAAYRVLIADLVAEHSGRVFGTAGDGFLAEFASAVQAVRMAVALQRALKRRNSDLPDDRRLEFRIGVNLGDVVVNGNDLLGNGVNIAARLQEIAQPAGICITAAVREQVDGKLDTGIERVGERGLKNIPQPVMIYRVDWDDAADFRGLMGGVPALPDRPSIAVLPFLNMSGDREQEYLADGISEDVITALSHHRWFLVIARNSTFAYKGKAQDIKQIARELGVRYVLEGSIRVAGSRVRATAQLIDAETGMHLIAERFDRDMADIFALQDEITRSVVAAIEPEMLLTEGRRAIRKNPANLDAFDRCMRGIWYFQQFSRSENRDAEVWLRQAIALDPGLALAHCYLARALNSRIWWGWSSDIDADVADECAAADLAASLDARDPYSHYAMCLASMITRRGEQSVAAAQRALDLNPNFALGYFGLGWARVYVGRAEEALEPLLHSLRLNPHDRQTETFLGQAALAQYHCGNFQEAVDYCRRALRVRRHHFMLRTLAAALGQMGRRDEAGPVLAELRETMPPNAARHWEVTMPYAHAPSRAFFEEGLRLAGFEIQAELEALKP
jgi:TolB-like protein/class 3 adenylate cyclase